MCVSWITKGKRAPAQVHPATGYSIVRSLREAPGLAVSVAEILKQSESVGATSRQVWEALWPLEKRRQARN